MVAGDTSPGNTDGTGAAARFTTPAGITSDGSGNLYVTETGNHLIRKITPAGVVTTLAGSTGKCRRRESMHVLMARLDYCRF
ncbi:MAG: hypothetical protein IPG86_12360 [Chitinophagaceae bacterium]|nr:hypothetical protein [Chitinophagaceae bacterium]